MREQEFARLLAGDVVRPAAGTVDVGLLLDLLTGDSRGQAHPRGVRVEGARITGVADWDWQRLRVPLELIDCDLDAPLCLDRAEVAGLTLTGCRLPGLSAEQMRCASTLTVAGCTVAGSMFLRDAEVSGAVVLRGTTILGTEDIPVPNRPATRTAVHATRLTVSGALVLGSAFTAEGAVRLAGARIGGNLLCHDSRIRHRTGHALEALDAEIGGSVILARGFAADGVVILDRARISGDLDCDGGTFVASAQDALRLNGAQIGGRMFTGGGFTAEGRVTLRGARIAAQWNCGGGTFTSRVGHEAIWASDAQIAGSVYFRDGFHCAGRIRMVGTQIGGNLGCEGAVLENPGRIALQTRNLVVGGDVDLGTRAGSGATLSATGEVVLFGARIGGSLRCEGASFDNAGRVALDLAECDVAGSVLLGGGLQVQGETRIGGARVGGKLDCSGGTFSNPDGMALAAVDLEVEDSVLLRQGFLAEGQVRLNRARIGGMLECFGGRFSHPGRIALHARTIDVGAAVLLGDSVVEGSVLLESARISGDLVCDGGTMHGDLLASGASITGKFRWRRITGPVGAMDLRNCRAEELDDDTTGWPAPGRLLVAGFTYARLSERAPRDPRTRVEWIRRQPGHTPEPYQQLAAVYRGSGQVSEATVVAVAQQDDLVRRGDLAWPVRIWQWFLGRTIGHGYRPGRAAWGLLMLYALTLVSVWFGARADAFIPVGQNSSRAVATSSNCTATYPCLSVPAYALETITPILNLHQADQWQPKSSTPAQSALRDWLYLCTVVGYAGTTLLAAGLSGLARNA